MLYDVKGDASYRLVKEKVAWFKQHRAILTSDIIHVKQPTGQGIDAFVHVNPRLLNEKAMAMVFNPTLMPITEHLRLPLYYAGLPDAVMVTIEGGSAAFPATLARDFSLTIAITVPAQTAVWVLITG
jgi:hypothetical protein